MIINKSAFERGFGHGLSIRRCLLILLQRPSVGRAPWVKLAYFVLAIRILS